MKLIPGDKVKFLNCPSENRIGYYCLGPAGAPEALLKTDGSVQMKINSGVVLVEFRPTEHSDAYCMHNKTDVGKPEDHSFYMVGYTDENGKTVQLGFMDMDLELIEVQAKPRFRISYVNNLGDDETVTIEAESKDEALNTIDNMKTLIYALGG